METLLFWLPPALFALIGLKGRLMTGWRLFFCGFAALYVGVWITPSWYKLLDFLPAAANGYRVGIAVAAGFAAVFALLYCSSRALAGSDDDFEFPVVPARVLNFVCRFGFGAVLSALLFTLCATTPLRGKTRSNGSGFQAGANAALLKFTAAGDALTRFKPAAPRSERLAGMWFPQAPKTEEAPGAPAGKPAEADPERTPEASGKPTPPPPPRRPRPGNGERRGNAPRPTTDDR